MSKLPRLALACLALGTLALAPALAADINPPRGGKPIAVPPKAPDALPAPAEPTVTPAPDVDPAPAAAIPAFEEQRPLTAAVLKEKFRDDYDSLVDQFAEIAETSTSPAERAQRGAEALGLIAQKYAAVLQKAPLAATKDIVLRFIDLHQAVLDKEGEKTCADFSNQGSLVLYQAGKSTDYLGDLDALGAVYFTAAADAQATPTNVDTALDEDWASLGRTLKEQGVPDSVFETLAKEDASDPEFCNAMIAMMRGMLDFEGDAGDRLRASLASSAAAY